MSEPIPSAPESPLVTPTDGDVEAAEHHGQHRLGPLVSLSEDRSNVTRLTALAVLVGTAGILGFAWHVNPDPKGVGTHRQLGLGPCGFLLTTGLPCPTCGMTTSFAYTVRGDLVDAFWAQPAGTLLALCTAGLGLVAVIVLATGRRLELNWYRVNPMHVLVTCIVIFLGSWVFKIVMVLLARRVTAGGA
jgi:hypothetical protein